MRIPHGFTLVELLVSITIIVILASMTLFAMSGAQKAAKIQRAKAQISRIHELLAEKLESYEGRRIPMVGPLPELNRDDKAWKRLCNLRRMMRYELPDRDQDLQAAYRALGNAPNASSSDPARSHELVSVDARYFLARTRKGTQNPISANDAECLYMIVSRMTVGESSALEFFNEREIGDKDGNGLQELLDPWGNPIHFIRWPTGFPSPMQDLNPANSDDGFDPQGIDDARRLKSPYPGGSLPPISFFYFPLVYSWGPDGDSDLSGDDKSLWRGPRQGGTEVDFHPLCPNPFTQFTSTGTRYDYQFSSNLPKMADAIDPTSADRLRLGSVMHRTEAIDNIYNHLLETDTK